MCNSQPVGALQLCGCVFDCARDFWELSFSWRKTEFALVDVRCFFGGHLVRLCCAVFLGFSVSGCLRLKDCFLGTSTAVDKNTVMNFTVALWSAARLPCSASQEISLLPCTEIDHVSFLVPSSLLASWRKRYFAI
jgi:hypothetical protein